MPPTVDLPLTDLVTRAACGDASAFEALIHRHERLALGVAFASLQDAPLAADVVQEAFVKAWRRLADLSQPASFAAWLCGIVRNLCVDHRRRKRVATCDLQQAAGEVDARCEHPMEAIHRRETAHRIEAALAHLDELTRSAIVLRYYENLTSRQIAELLDVSAASIDMRLMRGRAMLKEVLEGVGSQ